MSAAQTVVTAAAFRCCWQRRSYFACWGWLAYRALFVFHLEGERLSVGPASRCLCPVARSPRSPGMSLAWTARARPVALTSVLREPTNPQRVAAANAYLRGPAERRRGSHFHIDTDGRRFAASSALAAQFIGHNYAFRPYFRDALARGLGTLLWRWGDDRRTSCFTWRAGARPGKALGVIVLKVGELDSMEQALASRRYAAAGGWRRRRLPSAQRHWRYRIAGVACAAVAETPTPDVTVWQPAAVAADRRPCRSMP